MWWDPASFGIGLVLGMLAGMFLCALMNDLGKPRDDEWPATREEDHD